ncbi:phage holin family protein [Streptomonospora wellingtoniae]|uniref:Phage holin family protein n=1 Tax=Streptomonospora wellingtoniae TaxID=3075544 RepID=A0ABU2KXJ8_9ACTN|nr:phage holin family protein [Streptomonospora sp. DSM 45055]MDT0304040.1 phage holin family protein [Streptomonospora sp. DSM 45055]
MPETRSGLQEPEEFDAAEHSLGELVSEARGSMTRLVRLEVQLAKLELARDVQKIGMGAGLAVVAAVLAHMFLILVAITAGLGIMAAGLAPWLSFLIVTVVFLLISGLLLFLALRQFRKRQGFPLTGAAVASTLSALRRDNRTSNG